MMPQAAALKTLQRCQMAAITLTLVKYATEN
jgi:hypothetical protein